MAWAPARFKDSDVWAEVKADGALAVRQGRVAIRWSDKPGAKVYKGGASRIELTGGPAIEIEEKAGGSPGAAKKGGTRLASGKLPEGAAVAYTDGACRGNPGPAGSGVLLMLPDGRVAEAFRSLGHATNNIAELTAIDMALDLLDEAGIPAEHAVRLHTDSSYSIGVLAKGWKAKKNTELILGIRRHLEQRPGVELAWVRGHDGDPGNERADELARRGAEGRSSVNWAGA